MLHIQGNLQAVFDALYELGVIEPVLKMDWQAHLREMHDGGPQLDAALRVINTAVCNQTSLKSELLKLDAKALEILAMEVAREFAEFHSRSVAVLQ